MYTVGVGVHMDVGVFFDKLRDNGVKFFTGVPDSLLKDFGNYLYDVLSVPDHVIAANEGNAIALAAGSYLASGAIPLVYLQNSGLGNTINPLLSMADKHLYAIPMLILVGWRGKDKDAEQHMQQGRITPALVDTMGYPRTILCKDEDAAHQQIDAAMHQLKSNPQPHFIIVEEGSFDGYSPVKRPTALGNMSREEALAIIAQALPNDYFVVTTTGKTSREWFEVRQQLEQSHARDFLTVGSMGHTSSIALGMALASKERILCIDGDGSMLMHMGALAVAGSVARDNFQYIVINNGSHESVGGLPTPLEHVDFQGLFRSLGFSSYYRADATDNLQSQIGEFIQSQRAVFEVRVKQGSRSNLSRPATSAGESARILRREFENRRG